MLFCFLFLVPFAQAVVAREHQFREVPLNSLWWLRVQNASHFELQPLVAVGSCGNEWLSVQSDQLDVVEVSKQWCGDVLMPLCEVRFPRGIENVVTFLRTRMMMGETTKAVSGQSGASNVHSPVGSPLSPAFPLPYGWLIIMVKTLNCAPHEGYVGWHLASQTLFAHGVNIPTVGPSGSCFQYDASGFGGVKPIRYRGADVKSSTLNCVGGTSLRIQLFADKFCTATQLIRELPLSSLSSATVGDSLVYSFSGTDLEVFDIFSGSYLPSTSIVRWPDITYC